MFVWQQSSRAFFLCMSVEKVIRFYRSLKVNWKSSLFLGSSVISRGCLLLWRGNIFFLKLIFLIVNFYIYLVCFDIF